MPAPDDDMVEEPVSPVADELSAAMPALQLQSASATLPSPTHLLPMHDRSSPHSPAAGIRRRPRLHTALRLSAASATAYSTSAPHTSSAYHYTLVPPTLCLSASTLSSPSRPHHSTTAHDSFTFCHLFAPLDTPRAVHRQLLRPLLDGCVDGRQGGSVVVVCYGDDERAKAELLLGREAGAGVVVQAMGALLQAICERERGGKRSERRAKSEEQEEKREAEQDAVQQQPPAASHSASLPRRRKHRLTFSALRLGQSTLTDLLSPSTAVTLVAQSTVLPTVDVSGWTEHRVKEAGDCVRLLLRADKQAARAETADGHGHVVYRVGVQSRWRRDGGGDEAEHANGGRGGQDDGYRYSSLTFVKLASDLSCSASSTHPPSASSSTPLPFSPHWVNKDTLALTRVLSCLLQPSAEQQQQHVPYRSSPLTSALSSALEQCGELVLLFGLSERTDGGGESGGWDGGREEGRFVEERDGGVAKGKRQAEAAARRRKGWRGGSADEERDSDDEADERVPTVLEYYQAECAKRAALLHPHAAAPASPLPVSPAPQPAIDSSLPQPSRPATPPPTQPPPAAAKHEQRQEKQAPSSAEAQAADAAAAEAKRRKNEEAAAALTVRQQKEADNRAAILLARQQQQQRDLDRELRALQPLISALALPPRKVSTARQLGELRAEVERSLRQRVCGGVGVWKWSKKRVGGEVRRRECDVRWDEAADAVAWEGRKRWRQVTKQIRRAEVERLVVGGGVEGGVLEEWRARMRERAERKAAEGGGGEMSGEERSEMRRQCRAIDRWSLSVVGGGRVLDVVCDSEESHVVLLEGLKRLLGEAVAVEDRRPGNGGMKMRDVKV